MIKYKILPFFLPHQGCPHQCVFCDQRKITGIHSRISVKRIKKQIEAFASTPVATSKKIRKEVAFFGGSFTALAQDLQRSLLEPAYQSLIKGHIDGIRLSTRPDYCSLPAIELLKEYNVQTVELGVQSMDPEVLRLSGRGHGSRETVQAVNLLKSQGFTIGVQLMPGLPGEDRNCFVSTIQQVICLKPDFVRLYPTIVIKGTPLETLYLKGQYKPLSLDQAVELCTEGTKLLRAAGIRVIRCGLQPTPALEKKGAICAGPFHPAFGELVKSALIFEQVNTGIKILSSSIPQKAHIFIQSSPRLFSLLKGQRGVNLHRFKTLYPEHKILLKTDPHLGENTIRLMDETGVFLNICVKEF